MPPLERQANRLRSLFDDADVIIVGIGSGMSSAAGFNHYNRAGMEHWPFPAPHQVAIQNLALLAQATLLVSFNE